MRQEEDVLSKVAYYRSGVIQNSWIALLVLLVAAILGLEVFEDSDEQLSFDTFFLIVVAIGIIVGSVVFYLIFTRMSKSMVRTVYGVLLFSPFGLFVLEVMSLPQTAFSLVLAAVVALIGLRFSLVYIQGTANLITRNAGIIVSAVLLARIMALFFDIWSFVAFAIFLSLFDIYSVFRGPISKVMGRPQRVDNLYEVPTDMMMEAHFQRICKDGTPVLFSYQNTLLGIGDVLFFGVLLFIGLLLWGVMGFIITFVLINIGSSMTLFLLQRISPLPGLPFPVFLTLLGYLTLGLIFGI